MGVEYLAASVAPPAATEGRLAALATDRGETVSAGAYVFACGPWMAKLFPEVLGERIFTTRQEVFYIGPPTGEERFKVGAIPVWADFRRFWQTIGMCARWCVSVACPLRWRFLVLRMF